MDIDPRNFLPSIFRSSPGLGLVMLGFILVFFVGSTSIAYQSSASQPSPPVYVAIALGFFLVITGIVYLFRDLGKSTGLEDSDALLGPSSDLEHAVTQLGRNYEILRRQTMQGFILAGTFMAAGLLVILAGSLGELFGFTAQAGQLATIAGVVVEAISGLGLYLFRQTFQRLNVTSDRLHETWKVLTAFRYAEALPDDQKQKTEVIVGLINRLVGAPSS